MSVNWFHVVVFDSMPKCILRVGTATCWQEKIRVALPLEAKSVDRALKAVAYCRVDMVDHIWPVELTSHSVVHINVVGVSWQFSIKPLVENACLERVWYHGLQGAVK